jgi:hypothetical protein
MKDGDFDHFALDLQGLRLFLNAEDLSAVEAFDLGASKLVHPFLMSRRRTPWFIGPIQKRSSWWTGAGEVKI